MDKSAIRVLVIDDEAEVRHLLRQYLSNEGYSVDTAPTGEEGLDKLSVSKYNVVVCDIKMPGINGIETMERIKQHDPSIEVILITGYSSVTSAIESMKKGAFDYVKKPFKLEELDILIQRAVERRNTQMLLGLYEVSKLIFSTVRFDELLDKIIQLTGEVLGADGASIMLFDEEERLYVAAHSGLETDVASRTRVKMGEGIAGRIAAEKEPVILQGTIEDDPRFKGMKGKADIRSSIVHPLIIKGEVIGILNIKRTKGEDLYCEEDLKKTSVFASHIAMAIENANLYRELEAKVEELNRAYDDLQASQEQLVVSEKLAALGNMTAGVAHEINNPLTIVMGFTEHLMRSSGLPKEVGSILDKIHLSTVRCRRIIKNLLSFARAEGSEKRNLQILDILNDVKEFISHKMQLNNIELVTQFPDSLPLVNGNSDLLRQVILSIIGNAIYSVSSAGSAGRIVIRAMVDEGKIMLKFTDNGEGISEQNISKIFDPFFTTKKVGEGMGLGLSACYGILKDHGGCIHAESAKGEGAVFTVELPCTSRPPTQSGDYETTGERKFSRVKRILIIDDESFILDLYRDVLEEKEYQVETISDGREGLKRIMTGSHDLVILDWRMPGMDGKEIYRTVIERDPDLARKIVFVSGDTVNVDELDLLEHKERRFLSKPFKVEELMEVIRHFEEEQPVSSRE